jgi:hypothetical protein
MNNVTEPEAADVDLARAILSVKPCGNDNLLWLPSQVRLLISLLFRVRFSGLEILAGLAYQSQRLDYLIGVEPHVAGCVLYDTGGSHGVIFPMAGPVQFRWVVDGVHLVDKAGQIVLGTVRYRGQALVVLHGRPGDLRVVHLSDQNGFGDPERLKLGDMGQQLDHGPLSGLRDLMCFRLRYPFDSRQDSVPSGTQVLLKLLNLAATHLSDLLIKFGVAGGCGWSLDSWL